MGALDDAILTHEAGRVWWVEGLGTAGWWDDPEF